MIKDKIILAYGINKQELVFLLFLNSNKGIIVGRQVDFAIPIIYKLWECNEVERRGWGWLEKNIESPILFLRRSKAFLQSAGPYGWSQEKKLALVARVDQPTFDSLFE